MNFHGGDIYKYGTGIVDFSSNINPMGIPGSFRKLLAERLEDFTRYPDPEYLEVRKRIAAFLDFPDAECIIPGNGAAELIYKLAASSGVKRMASLRPTFSEYERAAKAAGQEFYDIPAFERDYEAVDVEMLLREIKPRSLVIICNPNNPTGTLMEKAAVEYLADCLSKLECRLVIDEAFIEFTDGYPENSMVNALKKHMNTTVIRAATKFFGMPGIRFGYAVSADMSVIEAAKRFMEPWNLNSAAVVAACCMFEDEDYIKKSRAWIKSEREYLFGELNRFRELKVYPSAANFHLLMLKEQRITAAELKKDMAESGVLIRTADGFRGLSQYHFRLAVKDRKSNNILLDALKENLGKAYI